MSAAITLAGGEHMKQLLSLMSRRRTEATGDDETEEVALSRQHAIKPLLDGGPEGAIWLVGPPRAPLGYVIVTFGWSVALGGREAWVEDVFVRPSVRRRGIGREVLHAIALSLRQAGVKAMQVRIPTDQQAATSFCAGAGFASASDMQLMTDVL